MQTTHIGFLKKALWPTIIAMLFSFAASLFAAAPAQAATIVANGVCGAEGDNITWTLYDDGLLSIDGTGAMEEWRRYLDVPWYESLGKITSVEIGGSVTTIGTNAFLRCWTLESITLPSSVISIGASAFEDCTSLSRVAISDLEAFLKCEYKNWSSHPTYYGASLFLDGALVNDIVIPSTITTIPEYAFAGLKSLSSVTIPNTVTSIGTEAFIDCTALEKVDIEDLGAYLTISYGNPYRSHPTYYGADLYLDGEPLVDAVIPDGVTYIPTYSFYGNELLASVSIPSSVTSVDYHAFEGCTSLKKVYARDLQSYLGCSFAEKTACPTNNGAELYLGGELLKAAEIPLGSTSISDYAFYGCTSLRSVALPDSVTSIGIGAFSGCTYLRTMVGPANCIGDAVKTAPRVTSVAITSGSKIPADSFGGYVSLVSVDIPDSVASIGDGAFYECDSLASVVIPPSVKSIESNAFWGCPSLKRVDISDLKSYLNCVFNDRFSSPTGYGADLYLDGALLDRVTLPAGISSVPAYAFKRCASLTSVVIPEGVTFIGEEAFEDCEALKYVDFVDFADSVDTLGNSAFAHCSSLSCVTFGSGIEFIDRNVFSESFPRNVFYIGSESDRASIFVDAGNGILNEAVWHYNQNHTPFSPVEQISLSDCTVSLSTTSYTYNAKTRTPSVTVKYEGVDVPSSCYKATYPESRYKAGTYKVTIKGTGNFTGTVTRSFTINPLKLTASNAKIKLSTTAYTYTGTAKKPAVTVTATVGGTSRTLMTARTASGTAIKLTYSGKRTAIGAYKVTATGTGNYTGSISTIFKINPAKTSVGSLVAGNNSLTVKWTPKKSAAKATGIQIRYSMSSKMTSPKTVTVASYKTASKTITKLKDKKRYYVQIRTYKKTSSGNKYYSAWSAAKSIVTK